ncbi:MAG: alpha/beta fold hydrolase [Bacteroidales bacterium]|nr:alpha/beta fold hydrolase [Bacteroidales bacterium]
MKRSVLSLVLMALSVEMVTGQLSLRDIEGSWSGKLIESGMELRMVFNFVMTDADTIRATLDSPDQNATGIPMGRVTLAEDSLFVEAPMIRGRYAGKVSGDSLITGRWVQLGKNYTIDLRRGTVAPATFNRPQEPIPPYPYSEVEVTFRNETEGFELAGTLTLPVGPGPFPAVVLISGSGQQDRDETIFHHKPFKVIADYLTRNGIAVMRYDDRGVGGSKGNLTAATSLSFAGDAEAAVTFLAGRPEIDPGKIGLAGHSEGGLIAPIVASRNSSIAFVISLAGPGVTGFDAIIQQNIDHFRVSGMSEEALATQLNMLRNLFGFIMAEEDQRTAAKKAMEWYSHDLDAKNLTPEERREQMSAFTQAIVQTNNPWWKYFLSTDPARFWSSVKCPVLALNGEKDIQINQKQNLPAIKSAVKKGGNRKVKAVALPDLNHLFQHAETGAITEYASIEETFSPGALDLMTRWIRKTLKMK